ncbi:MAG: CoB--CoM heterodisulfide reductase iron-sulfur subunit A family protein [Anaerolineae bacterium]|jgi:heterodisulfide reductase subunit A
MDRGKPAALVIGGGIAGIQAALDVADAGFPVYLVEREPSVGGRMAQLDKTFPTLDCSSCILTPKMVDVGQHPNIDLMTYAEVESVERQGDAFRVRVRKKPRYVDLDKCKGCGDCAEACRMKGRIVSDFDEGIAKRSAIYVPFPQAVPLKYTVDPEACLYLTRGVCGKTFLCKDACPADAIDFEQEETFVDLDVSTIIVATGFDLIEPESKPEYGYGVYPEVMTGIEFERLSDASGPTKGQILVNGEKPKDVVFIKCVGSRDLQTGVPYCSRVCCMYTAKHAHLVRDRIPDANITVFYMDVRAFGKGYEEFYDRVKRERVTYRRGEPSEVYRRGDKLVVLAEDTTLGEPVEVEADLVVLATAIVPRTDIEDMASVLGIDRSPDGFFQEADAKLRPVDTNVEDVFVAGCCQSPKDIPDTVAQAKAAASSALRVLVQAREDKRHPKAVPA